MAHKPPRPSIGRMVHYTSQGGDYERSGQHIAALVTAVYEPNDAEREQGSGTVCALTLFPPGRPPHALPMSIAEGKPGEQGTWHWPELV